MGQLQQIQFKVTKGMQQDTDPQVASTDTAYRLYNLKTLVTENGMGTALTNEKGNTLITLELDNGDEFTIDGTIIGSILCGNNGAVLFIYKSDTILQIVRITGNTSDLNTLQVKILAEGNFEIPNTQDPEQVDEDGNQYIISGIYVYENSELQKVYWVDGKNVLRYINIADSNSLFQDGPISNAVLLKTKPSFKIGHTFTVKRTVGTGLFPAGVIQYAFTYYNKYGPETGIVDISPLYYIKEDSRGLKADEITSCAFSINIENPDTTFDYIRLYSITRTSLNGVPVIRIVKDVKLK